MGDTLRSFFTWLLRTDRQQDPLLERYLQINREALESQRSNFSELDHSVVEEEAVEEPVEVIREGPEPVEDKPHARPSPVRVHFRWNIRMRHPLMRSMSRRSRMR